jgi:hypothetical protein
MIGGLAKRWVQQAMLIFFLSIRKLDDSHRASRLQTLPHWALLVEKRLRFSGPEL